MKLEKLYYLTCDLGNLLNVLLIMHKTIRMLKKRRKAVD